MKTMKFAVGCSYGDTDIKGLDGSLNSSYVTYYGETREEAIAIYDKKTSGHDSSYIRSIELTLDEQFDVD